MASAIEVSVVGFQGAFVASYGSPPSWLAAILSALMAALPGILSGCGVVPTPAGIKAGIAENPLGTNLKLRAVCREAGVPLAERGAAVSALLAAAKATNDADMNNLLTFAQTS
jgi:hypothetical protein